MTQRDLGPQREGEEPSPLMYGREKSDPAIVCAGQRPDREGSSPSGARMRSAVSKSGGNASLAEASGRYGAV
jgi:hypothetical protein